MNRERFKNDIIEYLKDPIRHGVFTQRFSFSIYSVDSLVKELQDEILKKYPRAWTETFTFSFKEFVDYEYWVDFETVLHNLNNIIRFVNLENRTKNRDHPICQWSDTIVWNLHHLHFTKDVKLEYFPAYAALLEECDAIQISKEGRDKKVFLTITTVGERGISSFNKFIKSIPKIGEEIQFTEIKKRHSQRYAFLPYPASVFLWVNILGYDYIPTSARHFINGALRYFRVGEWRTAIVLSAIAMEIMLAELYEENFCTETPDVSLGKLIKLLKEKISFPQEIYDAIILTNERRVGAVHRSRIELSKKEALDALIGTTKLALWFSSQL